MSTTNLMLGFLAYNDSNPGNNPMVRVFDLQYQLLGVQGSKPLAQDLIIPASSSMTIFNGTRTTSIDGTTAFDVSRPYPTLNTYRFINSAGTAPQLRTNRAIAVDDTTVFTVSVNGPVVTLTNTAGTAPDFSTVQVGDILRIDPSAGFSASNQGRFTIIAKTTSSISIQNISGNGETATLANTASNSFLIYSNGSAGNQVQIGDKVVLSAGFSAATLGTYIITEVTPFWFEVSAASPNGIPTESGIIPGASGIVFYSASKSVIMVAAQDRCSVRLNGDTTDNNLVEPKEVGNPNRPALYLKHGTAYSLVINNLSLNPLSVIVATVE